MSLGSLWNQLVGGAPDPEAQARVARGAVVLDVRTPEEYASGHHPRAKNIPVQALAGRVGELDRTHSIVVYCRSGARSASAASLLASLGFTDVYDARTLARLG